MPPTAAATGKDKASLPLAKDAAQMEMKLLELRKAMEKERAKREALMAGPGAQGSIWRNGGSGALRNKYSGRQSSQGTGTSPGAPQQDAGSKPGSAAARPASGLDASPSRLDQALHISPGAVRAGSASQAQGGGRSGGTATTSARAEVLQVHDDDGGGMACGTEGESDLMGGRFNEAESHKGFLEALEEWRKANRGEEASTASSQPAAGVSASARAGAQASAPIQVQTETARPRPASAAKPPSLFDKLMINSSARHAGAIATGMTSEEARAASLALLQPPPMRAVEEDEGADAHDSAAAAASPSSSSHLPPAGSGGARPGHAGGSSSSILERGLEVLDKLEELEIARAAQLAGEDDTLVLSITTDRNGVLTRNTRLPDAVVLPPIDQ